MPFPQSLCLKKMYESIKIYNMKYICKLYATSYLFMSCHVYLQYQVKVEFDNFNSFNFGAQMMPRNFEQV